MVVHIVTIGIQRVKSWL